MRFEKIRMTKQWYLYIALFFLFMHIYNLSLYPIWLSSDLAYWLVGIIMITGIVGVSIRRNGLKWNNISIFWFLLAFSFLFRNHLLLRNEYKAFFQSYILPFVTIIFIGYCPNWIEYTMKIVCFFSLEHVFFTLFFSVFPDIQMKYILPLFSADQVGYASVAIQQGYSIGITANYGYNAIYLSYALILCSSYILTSKEKTQKNKIKYWILEILIGIAILLSGKRGMLIYSIFSVIVLFFIMYSNNLKKLIRKVLGILTILFFSGSVATFFIPAFEKTIIRIVNVFNGKDVAMANRYILWDLAWNIFLENKWLGIGWGGYSELYDTYGIARLINERDGLNAHNVFLQLLCETGIIGTFVVLFVVLYSLFKSVKFLKMNKKSEYFTPMCFSVGIQLFFIMMFFSSNALYDFFVFCPYSIAIGIAIACFFDKKANMRVIMIGE